MTSALQSIIIFLHVLTGWLGLAVFFYFFKDLPRIFFTLWHYVAVVVIFGLVFFVYYRFFNHFSPFLTTAFALMALFTIEFVVYSFIYNGDLWFINPYDWLGSVIIAAVIIYFLGVVLAK